MIKLPLLKPELYSYTPHQSKMLLIDSVEEFSVEATSLKSSLKVSENSEFFNRDKKYIPTWISFEYMAQSIATLSGIKRRIASQIPKIGFIIGIRDFKSYVNGFYVGDKVDIIITESYREGHIAVFDAESYVGSKLCSTASLNVVESNQEILTKWADN